MKKEKTSTDIQAVLQAAGGCDKKEIERLTALAEKEMDCVKPIEERAATVPLRLAQAAKAVRLAGDMPYYLGRVMAVYFATAQGEEREFIAANGIKAAVTRYCGLEFECELLQAVAEAFAEFPSLGVDRDEKVTLMKEAYRQGDKYERVFRGCAQCAMAAATDVTGKENLDMFRAANGLAAGMGLLGDGACGGYSGGILTLGLYAGRRKEYFDGDKQEKDLCTKMVGKLHDKFIATYGSVICHDIHKDIFGRAFHITKKEDKEAFELAGAHTADKCPAVVGMAAAWVIEILYDEGFLTGKSEAKP